MFGIISENPPITPFSLGFEEHPKQTKKRKWMEESVPTRSKVHKFVIDKRRNIEVRDLLGRTLLMNAAAYNKIKAVKLLLEAGANMRAKDTLGEDALTIAFIKGHKEVVKLLVNNRDSEGETPLIHASKEGDFERVELNISMGADVHAGSQYGWTALTLSVAMGHVLIAQILIQNGAKVRAIDLAKAARGKDSRIAELLVHNGAKVDSVFSDGWTALMAAAQVGNTATVQLLIENGAKVNAVTENKETALLLALKNHHFDTAAFLIANGANVHAADNQGWTPLWLATKVEDMATMLLLIDKGIDVGAYLKEAIRGRNEKFGDFLLRALIAHEKRLGGRKGAALDRKLSPAIPVGGIRDIILDYVGGED